MNSAEPKDVIILGGGISGLTVAWYLQKAGIPFRLFEKEEETGGMITSFKEGGAVMDFGPNSLRDRNGEVRKLADDLGIADDLIRISESFKTRYIVRNGKLEGLKPNPLSLITNKIVSGKGKLRILAEPFMDRGDAGDESIGSFMERRIGKEAVDYLVDPVFSGIYAGDIYEMSKKAVLPKLAEWEHRFGSLTLGAIRGEKKKTAKNVKPMVVTFREGIQQLTRAMSEKMSDQISNAEVTEIKKTEYGYEVMAGEESIPASQVISCVPAHVLGPLIRNMDPEISAVLQAIDYAPMLSTQAIFKDRPQPERREGFGFLVPRKENKRLLGAIWKSSIFPELSEDGSRHFTLMTGGAHDRKVAEEDIHEIEEEVIAEFKNLMGMEGQPDYLKSRLWEKAIPQFHVGYEESIQMPIQDFERSTPGFHIGGNYRWGVSVPDCMEGARVLAQSLTDKGV